MPLLLTTILVTLLANNFDDPDQPVEVNLGNLKTPEPYIGSQVFIEGVLDVDFIDPSSGNRGKQAPRNFSEWAKRKRNHVSDVKLIVGKGRNAATLDLDISKLDDISLGLIDDRLRVIAYGKLVDGKNLEVTSIEAAHTEGITYKVTIVPPPEGVLAGKYQDYGVVGSIRNESSSSVDSAIIMIEGSHHHTRFIGRTFASVSKIRRDQEVEFNAIMPFWNEDRKAGTTAIEVRATILVYQGGTPPNLWPGFYPEVTLKKGQRPPKVTPALPQLHASPSRKQ